MFELTKKVIWQELTMILEKVWTCLSKFIKRHSD